MNFKILAAATLTAASFFSPLQAATLTATSQFAFGEDFSIVFNDANADGLLQFTEITSFSGISLLGANYVTSVPTIASISDYDGGAGGQTCGSFCSAGWYFSSADDGTWDIGVRSSEWTYEVTELAPVPVPASLPLLVFGLTGLGLMARRKLKVS